MHAPPPRLSPISRHSRGSPAQNCIRVDGEELIANINILLSTGHETTTYLLGNGLLLLLENPDQMQKLRAEPALLSRAIEEMLRYENPVQITYRSAIEDAKIHGRRICKGDLVNTIIASANRDPERFSDPNRFDITRSEGRHLGFGVGIHFCIGVPLGPAGSRDLLLRNYPAPFPQTRPATDDPGMAGTSHFPWC